MELVDPDPDPGELKLLSNSEKIMRKVILKN
jgi:hypothetical protein